MNRFRETDSSAISHFGALVASRRNAKTQRKIKTVFAGLSPNVGAPLGATSPTNAKRSP